MSIRILSVCRQKDRYLVTPEEGEPMRLCPETVEHYGLFLDCAFEEEELEAILKQDACYAAQRIALRYVAHAMRTEWQVRRKLKEKECSEPAAEFAIEKLKEWRYLDDEAYAEQFARTASEKMGPRAVEMKLIQRGIPRNLAAKMAGQFGEDQKESARRLVEKLQERYADLPEAKRRARIWGALQRKGYAWDEVRGLLSGHSEDEV